MEIPEYVTDAAKVIMEHIPDLSEYRHDLVAMDIAQDLANKGMLAVPENDSMTKAFKDQQRRGY